MVKRLLAAAGFDADHELPGTRQLRDHAFARRPGLARCVEHPSAPCLRRFFFVGERKLRSALELRGVVLVTAVLAPIALEDDLGFVVGFFARDEQPKVRQRLANVQTQLETVAFAVPPEELKKSRVLFNRMDPNRLTLGHRFDVELLVRFDRSGLINHRKFQVLVGRRLAQHFEWVVGGVFLFSACGSGHGLSSSLHFSIRNPFW